MSYFQHSHELPAWVGNPPAGWRADWLKWHVRLSTKRPNDDEAETLPYVANEDIASWTGKLLNEDPQPTDTDSRKFLADDVLFNKLRPYLAKIFHAPFDGACSGELLCLRGEDHVLPRYLFYAVGSKAFVDAVNAETFGSKMPRADWETVGHQPLPLPPLETQRRIAAYLDERTGRIDALMAKKQALLVLLAEKRQALITQAVTKGLNPDAPMKPSGIEWLGEIPAHWEVKRLKFVGRTRYGLGEPPELDDEGIPFVRATDIYRGRVDLSAVQRVASDSVPWRRQPQLKEGEVLVVRSGAYTGDSALVTSEIVGFIAGYDMVYTPTTINSVFVASTLLAKFMVDGQIQIAKQRAAQPHLNAEEFGDFVCGVPPPEEQSIIADYLEMQQQNLTSVEGAASRSIETLTEYRAALITAAVTGQIEGLR